MYETIIETHCRSINVKNSNYFFKKYENLINETKLRFQKILQITLLQLLLDQESLPTFEVGLKPWQVEMLAQKLEEINQIGNDDYAFERSLRSGTEKKRRYRTCFFNPVSCFKK